MKQLKTTLFAVLQAIAMPAWKAIFLLSLVACDEKIPEVAVPSPMADTSSSSSILTRRTSLPTSSVMLPV